MLFEPDLALHGLPLAHVPAKAWPGLDPGWIPVRRQEHAPLNRCRSMFRFQRNERCSRRAVRCTPDGRAVDDSSEVSAKHFAGRTTVASVEISRCVPASPPHRWAETKKPARGAAGSAEAAMLREGVLRAKRPP